jgi:hypothetical protein
MISPDTPDATPPRSPSPPLPAPPWILLDRTTATQTAAVLDRLEQWLAGAGEPAAVAACAAACSLEEDDAIGVAAWLGALATRLERRIEEDRVRVVAPRAVGVGSLLASALRRCPGTRRRSRPYGRCAVAFGEPGTPPEPRAGTRRADARRDPLITRAAVCPVLE